MNDIADALVARTRAFALETQSITFSFEGYIYNPLDYAWQVHELYLRQYVHHEPDLFFLGMNPGPFGMAQTGVPFGEIEAVEQWMHLSGSIGKPKREHPARPVLGFSTTRSEVSGKRLWSLMQERFGSADAFFSCNAVMNYCPLVFMDGGKTGKNVVPEKLPKEERNQLDRVCDSYLDDIVNLVEPRALVGVGVFARKRLESCARRLHLDIPVTSILHPSPGNPQANNGWDRKVTAQLREAGLWS